MAVIRQTVRKSVGGVQVSKTTKTPKVNPNDKVALNLQANVLKLLKSVPVLKEVPKKQWPTRGTHDNGFYVVVNNQRRELIQFQLPEVRNFNKQVFKRTALVNPWKNTLIVRNYRGAEQNFLTIPLKQKFTGNINADEFNRLNNLVSPQPSGGGNGTKWQKAGAGSNTFGGGNFGGVSGPL